MSNFPSKIKKLRIANGLTQKQIAESLNVSQNAIYNWENGKREPNLDMIKQIAKYFDFPLYLLLDDNYELGDIALEKKGARTIGDTEMTEPPRPFTVPLSQYHNKDDGIYIDPNLQALYEIAMQKAQNREELTDEEEQILIGIPRKLRKKCDDFLSNENSYSSVSSEEEFNILQKERQIELKKESASAIHKYDATVEIAPEAMERLKEDAEAREILKKYESGKKILEIEYEKVIDYHNRMMERSKLLQDWLEWYKSTCEPLNNEGRKKVAEYAETLAETDKYSKPKEWFQGRTTKEEIEKTVEAYLDDDNSQEADTTSPDPPEE